MNSNSTTLMHLKHECGQYSSYMVQLQILRDKIRMARAKGSPCGIEIEALNTIDEKIASIEGMLDRIEKENGIESRILLWRTVIGHEDLRHVASEKGMDPMDLNTQIEDLLFHDLISQTHLSLEAAYA
ncbi:MAG: hypothetical protein SOI44_01935 [Lactimicrobium sp.]|jgi:hypothetical protein|uniref:hypothetical protein n=1 Tax=Lactimicrobium sp. TaxID=2563780 RepID=UPI002F350B54